MSNEDDFDVVVVGGGPAGISAAVAAGRRGVRVLLIEMAGCLGGIWTSGLLTWVLDVAEKGGFLAELVARLKDQSDYVSAAHAKDEFYDGSGDFAYDVEGMKYLLDRLCQEAGVTVLLYTRVVGAEVTGDRIAGAVIENFDGRSTVTAQLFIDCSGSGEFAARAGNDYTAGHPRTGKTQAASLIGVVTGFPADLVTTNRTDLKNQFRADLEVVGAPPSYRLPVLVRLPNPMLASISINHEYDVACDDTMRITQATIHARDELYRAVSALRALPNWSEVRLVATASYIGLREGRRLTGRYTVTADDMVAGTRFEDGICLVGLPVDIHGLDDGDDAVSRGNMSTKPYHIPLRSLISDRFANLGFAGRCIDGDFYAHASYRVTGNAVPMGEAIGIAAGIAVGVSVGQAVFGAAEPAAVRAALISAGHRL